MEFSLIPDVFSYLLSFVGLEDLVNVSLVCKAWKKIVDGENFWRYKCVDNGYYGKYPTWKELFITMYLLPDYWVTKYPFCNYGVSRDSYWLCFKTLEKRKLYYLEIMVKKADSGVFGFENNIARYNHRIAISFRSDVEDTRELYCFKCDFVDTCRRNGGFINEEPLYVSDGDKLGCLCEPCENTTKITYFHNGNKYIQGKTPD